MSRLDPMQIERDLIAFMSDNRLQIDALTGKIITEMQGKHPIAAIGALLITLSAAMDQACRSLPSKTEAKVWREGMCQYINSFTANYERARQQAEGAGIAIPTLN